MKPYPTGPMMRQVSTNSRSCFLNGSWRKSAGHPLMVVKCIRNTSHRVGLSPAAAGSRSFPSICDGTMVALTIYPANEFFNLMYIL